MPAAAGAVVAAAGGGSAQMRLQISAMPSTTFFWNTRTTVTTKTTTTTTTMRIDLRLSLWLRYPPRRLRLLLPLLSLVVLDSASIFGVRPSCAPPRLDVSSRPLRHLFHSVNELFNSMGKQTP